MSPAIRPLIAFGCIALFFGCNNPQPDPPKLSRLAELGLPNDTNLTVKETRYVDGLEPLVQFETVFWEPPDTTSLRKLILETDLVRDKTVLEIGSGTGLISLCCLQAGAKRVVATDINPSAVANTLYNADQLGLAERLDVRLVAQDNPSAYAVLKSQEQFDLIISNPPWEDGTAERFEDNAFYDPQFALLKSLLGDFENHLADQGRILLAYGCVEAIRKVHEVAAERNLACEQLDDRSLDELPNMFLPGMLLEVQREKAR